MMIAIESEVLFRTFMEFSFVLFLRVWSASQDVFMLSFLMNYCDAIGNALGRERQECGAEHYVSGKGMEQLSFQTVIKNALLL